MKHVLIAAEPDLAMVYGAFLDLAGYQDDFAGSVEELIAQGRSQQPDLIIVHSSVARRRLDDLINFLATELPQCPVILESSIGFSQEDENKLRPYPQVEIVYQSTKFLDWVSLIEQALQTKTGTQQHVFVAPHLDDAVLSCGGTIYQLSQAGEDVVVMTMMAGDSLSDKVDSPLIQDLEKRWQAGENPIELRRQEDRRAVESLGAQVRHIMHPDCIYRHAKVRGNALPYYPTEESLWGPIHPADQKSSWLDRLRVPPGATVYLPLGAGRHVDHRIVRDWGLRLAERESLALIWYAEYPYIEREAAEEQALAAFAPRVLEADLRYLSEQDLSAKIEAIRCYASQISTFWADTAAMETALRATMQKTGGGQSAERFWRIVSAQ